MLKQYSQVGTAKLTSLISGVILVVVTVFILIGVSISRSAKSDAPPPLISEDAKCNNGGAKHEGLADSSNRQLKKLAEYEQVCDGAVTDSLMFFTQMPNDEEHITENVSITVETLREYAKFGIRPLVVFEPYIEDEEILLHIQQGMYDETIEKYFKALKDQGVTDNMMGTWILFPEANTPTWHNTDPAVYSSNLVKVSDMLKSNFPDVQVSTLLNSRSYPTGDMDWSDGSYQSLVPYLDGVTESSVDMFGYQGFPWLPPANDPTSEPITDASTYLRADLASEAARELGTEYIWLNTGTFGQAYTNEPDKAIWVSAEERKSMLQAVLVQVDALLDEGFHVSVNLFAENKVHSTEGVDWSYWQADKAEESDSTVVFKGFVGALRELGADFTLYDATPF